MLVIHYVCYLCESILDKHKFKCRGTVDDTMQAIDTIRIQYLCFTEPPLQPSVSNNSQFGND